MTQVKTPEEIAAIRRSGQILAAVLEALVERAKVGVTGIELDKLARQMVADAKAELPFLGYQGFPAAVCISINDAVVHGIPNDRPFASGDLVSIDFGVRYGGMITDAARTVIIGDQASNQVRKLVRQTEQSLLTGIQAVHGGVRVGTVANVIEQVLAAAHLGIVRDLVGHGVGHHLHEDPNIPNYGQPDTGPSLQTGMTIAIEPMATLGDYRVFVEDDGWTVRTADHTLAAHFEDTILITKDGAEILTR